MYKKEIPVVWIVTLLLNEHCTQDNDVHDTKVSPMVN